MPAPKAGYQKFLRAPWINSPHVKGRTIGAALKAEGRHNNFDLIRFVAATLVIISHSFAAAGGHTEPGIGSNSLGTIGVYVFFTISGFLVTRSWLLHPRVSAFIGKRLLRILPGLAGATLFVLFIIGPIFTTLPLKQYFKDPLTLLYIGNIGIFSLNYNLPGVFTHNSFANNVNGSIWTLPHEFIAYIGIGFAGAFGLLKKRPPVVWSYALVLIASYVLISIFKNTALYVLDLQLAPFFHMIPFFVIGSLLYIHRDKIPLSELWALIATILLVVSPHIHGQYYIRLLVIPYLVIFLALIPTRYARQFGRYGDFSYGIYIYGWTVQQSIEAISKEAIGPLHMLAYTFPITLLLAIASWYVIEKPFLKLKTRFNTARYPVQV